MSPSALALAVLLHASVVLALWWMSLQRPQLPSTDDPVEVTFEQPKPPEPPPAPPKQQPPAPAEPLGLMPEAAITSDKRTQVPTAPVRPNEAPAPQAPAQADRPTPFAFSPAPSAPPPPRPPSPPEAVARPPAQPTTPLASPLPAPALPAPASPPSPALPAPAAPPAHALATPPPASPAPQRPDLHPAPATPAPSQRPAAPAHSEPPSSSPFVNPADTYAQARVADNYLWQIARKLQGYHYQAHVSVSHGTTVVRVVIARDGRLLDVEVAQTSGIPEFDRGVVAGVRAGSPYAPLPAEIHGDRATFTLPLVSVNRQ
jgi:protein TonB